MSHKSYLYKTIMSSWLSLVITSACQLVMIPIALGALDKVDFALFAVISQMLTAIMLAEIGIRSASARLLIDARANGEIAYNKVWMASACVFFVQALVMLLLIICLAPFLEQIFHLDPEQCSVARGVFIAVGLINTFGYTLSIFSTALLAGQKLGKINIITALTALVQLVVFVVAIKMDFKLWAYPISIGLTMLCSQVLLVRQAFKSKLVGKFDFSLLEMTEVKVIFSLGMDVFVAALFSVVMGHSLLLFSGHLLTLEETAILAVNLKLVNMMTQVLQRVPGSAEPLLMKMVSEGQLDQFRVWWKLVAKATILLSLFAAGMFVLWSEFVITAWTSKEEMVIHGAALVLLALIPFRYLSHYVFVNSLGIFKEIRKVKWFLLWEVVLYTGLAFWLGTRFGLIGLLSANLLSMLGGALLSGMNFFSFYSRIPFGHLLALFIRLTLPLSFTFFVLKSLTNGFIGEGVVYSTGMSLVWSLLFVVICFFIVLDQNEQNQLKVLAQKFRAKKGHRQ